MRVALMNDNESTAFMALKDDANPSEVVWNFSFGSNMNPIALIERRKIQPIESVPCSVTGWKLTFNYGAMPFLEPGMGTVERDPAGILHGVAHKVPASRRFAIRQVKESRLIALNLVLHR
jgi:hypothetical protein